MKKIIKKANSLDIDPQVGDFLLNWNRNKKLPKNKILVIGKLNSNNELEDIREIQLTNTDK